jgi:FAD synthetase
MILTDSYTYCLSRYNLDVIKIAANMKSSLQTFLDSNPQVKAIFIGTRRTDPYSGNALILLNLQITHTPDSQRPNRKTYALSYLHVNVFSVVSYTEHLTEFLETDSDWPKIMRIHPIVDWSYKDIWDFLIEFRVPYCVLYDKGYTSLGGTSNTFPNPALRREEDGGYDPAYKLTDGSKERDGRAKKK